MDVVVVESPAKAKTINKYLGTGYTVLASFGHVRDLPSKDGSVRPDEDFAMDWEMDGQSKKRLDDIARALNGADRLYLATDPDREGEAISWHVKEALDKKRALNDVEVKRVVFHEITKDAVVDAIDNPRDIDANLVDAYLARRALDYLVGFTLSPVLWRKLPGSRSAGRVQSVALRLICEREAEIEAFRPQEYWSIEADFLTPRRDSFTARLVRFQGEKVERLTLKSQAEAQAAVQAIEQGSFAVGAVDRREVKRHPAPPFTTSTLQQEASRKLGLSASQAMRLAQQLYEGVSIGGETVGLITYMRTDSTTLSNDALGSIRRQISSQYGEQYVPPSPRTYKTKAKNAQEAHEAVRPTDAFRRPQDISSYLQRDQLRLYELIWKRTVASQMASAVLDQVSVTVESQNRLTALRATGSVIKFDGFLKLYREDLDEPKEDDDEGRILPRVDEGEAVERGEIRPDQHFTQPPPRFTEASLVKKLEELGIGRPSTYASIIQVLQDRNYVRLEKRRFTPEDRGRVVTSFLTNFFNRYVEYDFTAQLENQLDDISGGRIDWKQVLRDFWVAFSDAVEGTKKLTITQVIDALDAALGPHFFPADAEGGDARKCPSCEDGRLGLKLGKFGGFIGCSNYPECRYTRQLALSQNGDDPARAAAQPDARDLGIDPDTGLPVKIKVGPYGPYVQLGEDAPATKEKGKTKSKEKPKRVSLPKKLPPDDVDLDIGLRLLALPREVGIHPESGKPILAGIGRYGPYVQMERTYKSLQADDDVLTVGINRAVDLLAQGGRGGGGNGSTREVGAHPDDGKKISAGEGRFGPYVKHGKLYASLPKDLAIEDVTLDKAVELLRAKAERVAEKKGKSGKTKTKAKAKPRAKTAARKTTKAADAAETDG